MTDNENDLCFYILMRTDMASMNPGKGHAQSAHAAHAIAFQISSEPEPIREQYGQWASQTSQGFGTTITKGVNERQMRGVVELALAAGFCAGIVHDPEYPLVDGDVVHLLPLDTCGYVFGNKSALDALLRQFDLHP